MMPCWPNIGVKVMNKTADCWFDWKGQRYEFSKMTNEHLERAIKYCEARTKNIASSPCVVYPAYNNLKAELQRRKDPRLVCSNCQGKKDAGQWVCTSCWDIYCKGDQQARQAIHKAQQDYGVFK